MVIVVLPSLFMLFQILSMLGGDYKHDSASAFAIFRFMFSASSAIAFAYSSRLTLYWQILIGRAAPL